MTRLTAYLHEDGVPFEMQHHHKAFTARQVALTERIAGSLIAKVVIAFADGKMVMLVVPASQRVFPAAVARALRVDLLRIAEEEEFEARFPDCEPGAMPPFGNLYDLPVYVDRFLAQNERIVFQAGTHTETISMAYADYERLVKPVVAGLTWEEAMAARRQG